MKIIKLSKYASVALSNVDKKSKTNEKTVRLCNYTDVYYNWAITNYRLKDAMVSTAPESQISKFKLKKGQILITKDSETRDDIGSAAIVSDNFDDMLLGYHCALIELNSDEVDPKYLNALLHTNYSQKYFENNATGSGQRYTLTEDVLKNFPLPWIDVEQQKKIGKMFSDIDKRIELCQKTIDVLENTAKLIYDQWFLRYEYCDKESHPYKTNGGQLVYNELLKRDVPKGWTVNLLSKVAEITYGFPLSTELFGEEGKPVVRIRDIEGGTVSSHTTESVPESCLSQIGDLLIGMDGNFQQNIWHRAGDVINQRIARIHSSKIPILIVKYQIQPYLAAKADRVARSTVGHLGDEDIKELQILVPSNELDCKIFDDIAKKQCFAREEMERLNCLKNDLLKSFFTMQF